MYEKLSVITILIQIIFFTAMMPFVVRQFKRLSRYRALNEIMYTRAIKLLNDINDYDFARGRSLEYFDELKLDFRAATAWRKNPKDRLLCITAFVDKWEAMVADGKILKTRSEQ